MNEQNLIKQIVNTRGRSAISEALQLYLAELLEKEKVSERLPKLIKQALELCEKLDQDRSIPWIKE